MKEHSALSATQRLEVNTVGFTKVEKFIELETLHHIENVISKWMKQFETSHGYTPLKFPFFELDSIFIQLMEHTLILDCGKQFLGPWFRFDHAIGINQPGKIKRKDGSFAIQDHERGNLHGGPLESQRSCFSYQSGENVFWGQLNVGIVLENQEKGDGGFCYVPASHYLPNGSQASKILNEVMINNYSSTLLQYPELNKGDLILFTEALIHGMGPWKAKNKSRRVIYYKYSPGFLAWRKYDEIKHYMDLATTETQRLLLRPPFVSEYTDVPTVSDNSFRQPIEKIPEISLLGRAGRKMVRKLNLG